MPTNFDDLDDGLKATMATFEKARADIRASAHIVNGGERNHVACPKCGGSGQTRWGRCFRCEGKGAVSARSAAASQAKVTRERNEAERRADFAREHSDVIAFLDANLGWSDFYRSLSEQLLERGTLSENQVAAVRRGMAKRAARTEERKIERVASAPFVEISAIEKLFATATDNDVKKPIFRADGIELSKAPANGRNAGALYVKREGNYVGKIVDGRFQAVREAPADTLDRLLAVAADPLGESIKYARRTGCCGLCGRELVDPVSIRALVGPICAPKWGLDWKRDEARAELANERAAELCALDMNYLPEEDEDVSDAIRNAHGDEGAEHFEEDAA